MLCQNCGKHPATTYIKETVNGKTTEKHLCSSCAQQQGLTSMLGGFGFDLYDFWGSLFSRPETRELEDTARCDNCGKSFMEIAQSGRAGCPDCYRVFYDRLLPSIQRIHGKSQHTGKAASGAGTQLKKEKELESLRRQLADRIANQRYEECAALRDRIAQLEKGEDEG